jgi:hypothetical protein
MTVTVTDTGEGPIVEATADTLHDAYTKALRKIWADYGTAVKLYTQETMDSAQDYVSEEVLVGAYVRIRVEFPAEPHP